jgi:hypothetical protein
MQPIAAATGNPRPRKFHIVLRTIVGVDFMRQGDHNITPYVTDLSTSRLEPSNTTAIDVRLRTKDGD